MLKITLTAGLIGKRESQRKVIRALGLGKYGSSVLHADSPTIRGMINKVHHLVTVTACKGSDDKVLKTKSKAAKIASKVEA